MRAEIRLITGLGLGLVIITGCAGGASPGGSASATGSPAASAAASAAASTAPSSGASAAASAPPAGGGGQASDVCGLVTTDELAGIFSVASVTTQVLAGPPDTCDIQADGAPLAAMVWMPSGGTMVYDAYAGDPASQQITGIGDKAAFNPTAQLLVVLKGDSMISIAAFDDGRPVEERIELMKQIATIAVGRM